MEDMWKLKRIVFGLRPDIFDTENIGEILNRGIDEKVLKTV